ncbi:MAG TPA: hypothetical protein VN641_00130, partial [Urbifossiella sp.]|nr:hypothetical protein [Urbifossiella sp.]
GPFPVARFLGPWPAAKDHPIIGGRRSQLFARKGNASVLILVAQAFLPMRGFAQARMPVPPN